jgi:hypothetical protein
MKTTHEALSGASRNARVSIGYNVPILWLAFEVLQQLCLVLGR